MSSRDSIIGDAFQIIKEKLYQSLKLRDWQLYEVCHYDITSNLQLSNQTEMKKVCEIQL